MSLVYIYFKADEILVKVKNFFIKVMHFINGVNGLHYAIHD